MYSDFHIHSHHSFDSQEDAKNIIEKCIMLHMDELCFTDHNDFDWPAPDENADLNIVEYYRELTALRERYADKIKVNIGVECGLTPDNATKNKSLIQDNPFDFVIGSCHIIDGMDPYYPEYFAGKTDRQAFEQYFNALKNSIDSFHDFDVLGHIDYVVRYSPNKSNNYSYYDYTDQIDYILKKIIDLGKGIEINTSGLKSGLPFANPCPDILARYRELGGEIITIGSDAHHADFIGYKFDIAGAFLKNAGFQYYCTFHNRETIFKRL